MTAAMVHDILGSLEDRRKELGMSFEALVKRSGVSRATVRRILSGDHATASFANVVAVAEALGVGVRLDPIAPAEEYEEREAERKARRLVSMVQGTMGLESQAVDAAAVSRMV